MPTPRRRDSALPRPLLLLLLLVVVAMAPSAAAQADASRDKDNGGGLVGPPGGRLTQPPGFSAPMAGLLVALVVAFFFIGFFSVYMRRCGRGGGPVIPAAALRALSRRQERDRDQQRGLDPAVVASFPTMRYAEARELRVGGKQDDAALECAVCLSEFDDDEELRLLPTCSHAFHPDCIGEWLAGHVTCPVCRCNLLVDDPDDDDEVVDAFERTPSSSPAGERDRVAAVIDVTREGVVDDDEEKRREATELDRIGSQQLRRTVRNRSVGMPRSHSTGHSLAQRLDGGDLERFTLRLPEHVRREMVAAGSLRRTGPGPGRRDRDVRSDRWPSFIARTFSGRVPFWAASRRAPVVDAEEGSTALSNKREKPPVAAAAEGSVTNSTRSVRFDCLLGNGSGARVGDDDSDAEEEDDEEKAIDRRRAVRQA